MNGSSGTSGLGDIETLRDYELKRVFCEIKKLKMQDPVMLEVGAGAGWQAKQFSEAGISVVAIDLAGGEYDGIRVWPVLPYGGMHIPCPSNYFDIIFSSNVLEHILKLDEFQKELQRVMKSDGIAIHVLPSGSWRFWTNLSHYIYGARALLQSIHRKIFFHQAQKSDKPQDSTHLTNPKPKRNLFKLFFPDRHGEIGNAVSEIYWFSRYRWKAHFEKTGWFVLKIFPNFLFYTGYTLLGTKLSISIRKYLSYILGSSANIFVLKRSNSNLRE